MADILSEYALFLAKTVTFVAAFLAMVIIVARARGKKHPKEGIEVQKLNKKYEDMHQTLKEEVLSREERKQEAKLEKKRRKEQEKAASSEHKKKLFILNFHGDIKASAVTALREEITAALTLATPEDEVFVHLESHGGLVHSYGLAASQLSRVRKRGIPLTVSVDKIAASGGYMMACVANRIIAAPFAIIGSIGVIAQLPNFHRLLQKNDIDYEQIMAGQYKRTLTLFGENTDAAREKFRAEVEDTHELFKDFIRENRDSVDITRIATGEHWYGSRAIELNLVDELKTSDDYLVEASQENDLYEVKYIPKKDLRSKFMSLMPHALRNYWL